MNLSAATCKRISKSPKTIFVEKEISPSSHFSHFLHKQHHHSSHNLSSQSSPVIPSHLPHLCFVTKQPSHYVPSSPSAPAPSESRGTEKMNILLKVIRSCQHSSEAIFSKTFSYQSLQGIKTEGKVLEDIK